MEHKAVVSLVPKTLETATSGARGVLEGAKSKLGFIPNLYGNLANSPGALSTYFHGYGQFREHSGLTPAEQEAVLLTVSIVNVCSYCVAAHSMVAEKMSGLPAPVLAAIRNGAAIPDARISALVTFTHQMMQSRGMPKVSDVQAFLAAGYKEEQILEIVLAIAVKTISNFTNHLFNTPVDPVFAGYAWPETK